MTTEKEFEQHAQIIRSEQMPLGDMMILFRDEPKFADWYKKKYLLHSQGTSQLVTQALSRHPKAPPRTKLGVALCNE